MDLEREMDFLEKDHTLAASNNLWADSFGLVGPAYMDHLTVCNHLLEGFDRLAEIIAKDCTVGLEKERVGNDLELYKEGS